MGYTIAAMNELEPLMSMGLPWGPPGAAPTPPNATLTEVRKVIERLAAAAELPAPPLRDPLLAWLAAFRHHWPTTWASEIGPAGEALFARLSAGPIDRNRYLKLRRIAIASLAQHI